MKLEGSASFDGRYSELLDGTIYFRPHRFSREARVACDLGFALRDAMECLRGDFEWGMLGSVAMPPHDGPAPDITIYRKGHGELLIPGEAVMLVVEVRTTRLIAILDPRLRSTRAATCRSLGDHVDGGMLHRMWSPLPDGYAERDETPLDERADSATVAGLETETGGLV